MTWQPIHSGIAACLLDGLSRVQMCAALGRSNQGITYRMEQMRQMIGIEHKRCRTELIVSLIHMERDGIPERLR
jgi:hypothetical protein